MGEFREGGREFLSLDFLEVIGREGFGIFLSWF